MNDRQLFTKTFGKLHPSKDVVHEVLNMAANEKETYVRRSYRVPRLAVLVTAICLMVGCGTAAYAMDAGGIQRIVQIWIHGDQTEAVFTVENGSYQLEYQTADGSTAVRGGGGVALERDGTERPLAAEELMEHINSPEVEYREDGTVWVYCDDRKIEITDKFEDGYSYLKLYVNGELLYMTVKYQNGYALSPHGYIQPNQF